MAKLKVKTDSDGYMTLWRDDEYLDDLGTFEDMDTDQTGFCLDCGAVQVAEPDARTNHCEACGEPRVIGYMVLLGLA